MTEPLDVRLETPRLLLALAAPNAVQQVVAYYVENRAHLEPWEPHRPAGWLDETAVRARLAHAREELALDQSLRLLLFARSDGRMIGTCNFTQIVRGPLQACVLGYSLAQREQGKGYMTEALGAAIGLVWSFLRLHRVEASYAPTNERSGRLLRRFGFVVEGYARDYLFTGGVWRDHIRTALTNPEHRWSEPWKPR